MCYIQSVNERGCIYKNVRVRECATYEFAHLINFSPVGGFSLQNRRT